MIRSFADVETERLFYKGRTRRFNSFVRVAQRKLQGLDNTKVLADLAVPAGNKLEALREIGPGSTGFASTISTGLLSLGWGTA